MSRNVLAPPTNRMSGNRCYRVNLVHGDFGSIPIKDRTSRIPSGQTQPYNEPNVDELEDDDVIPNIEEMTNGIFKLSMHVPSSLYGGIIGFKGSTKRRIETETDTEINIPRNRDSKSNRIENITIKGKSTEKVLAARRQLNILIGSLRSRMKPTHFIGLFLKSTEIQTRFTKFKEEVLALESDGIVKDIFQDDTRIHITLGVCTLLDEIERQQAVALLQASRELLSNCTSFQLKISGLEIMNDDPSAVSVLYASVDAPELQIFANKLMSPFEKAGLSFDKIKRTSVKLHMTLLNKRYLKNEEMTNTTNTFDAREILKNFGNYDFGSASCNEIMLCVMQGKTKEGDFYTVTGKLVI